MHGVESVNERTITVAVLKDLRSRLHGSEVLKHMDTGTRGIPDISVGLLDRTSWIELKYQRRGRSLKEINDAGQLSMCHRLAIVHRGRSWVVVYEEDPYQVTVWQPRALFAHLWPRVAGPSDWSKIGIEPLMIPATEFTKHDFHKLLDVHGAITINDWSYKLPTYLVLNGMNQR